MILTCVVLMVVGLMLSAPLCRWLVGAGHRWGQIDEPDDPAAGGRKWHGRAVPNTGGIGITFAVLAPWTLLLVLAHAVAVEGASPLARVPAALRSGGFQPVGIALAVLLIHALGVMDDRRRLGAGVKLAAQCLVALGLALLADVRVLQMLDAWGPGGVAVSVALSVVWLVTITNAMNFLDNMDGLSAGVGAVITSLYLAATLLTGQDDVAMLCALLLGALLGFLRHNFPPARIFMGDGGSLVLGLLLGIISIRTTYLQPAPGGEAATLAGGQWHGVLVPVVVMAVPLYDLLSVTLIRLAQGRSPWVGDRNHFSHRLVRKGLSQRSAVLVIWACTLATGLGGVMLASLKPWQAVLVAGQTLCMLAVLALLERTAPSRPQP